MTKFLQYTILILFGFIAKGPLLAQDYKLIVDSLMRQNDTMELSPQKVKLLNKIAFNHRRLVPDTMLYYAEKAYELAEIIDDKAGQTEALKNIGIAHYKKSSPVDTIVQYYKNASILAAHIEDFYTEAACNNNIALVYMQQNELDKSLGYFLEALDVFNTKYKKPHALKAKILGNSGTIYAEQGDHEQALTYLTEAIRYAKVNNFDRARVMYMDNLGVELYEKGDTLAAIEMIEEALVLQRKLGDVQSITQTLVAYAGVLLKENELEKATAYAEEALQLAKKNKLKIEICKALEQCSRIALHQEKSDEALIHASEALSTATEMGNLRFQVDALKTLVDIYSYKEDFENAYMLTERIKILEDSTREELVRARDLQTKYDLRERQRALDSLTNATALNAEVNQRKKLEEQQQHTRSLLLISSILSILFFSALFWAVSNNRKLREKNKQLDIARQQAEEASRIKQEFLSTMSHEIRTPMNAVIGFTDILLEDAPKQSQVSMLSNLKVSGQHLLNLINDILDLSKLEAGKIELEAIAFDLKKTLQELITIFDITKENDAITLLLDWQGEELSRYVIGDSVRLTQVLSNLISNAIKFTPKGNVILRVLVGESEKDIQHLRFEVEDSGIGIPKEKQQLIFENFSQASSSITREFGGTGLGLAITKQILELQDSTIELESEVGKGSTFRFNLTLGLGIPLSEGKTEAPFDYAKHRLDGVRILLAEDNLFSQKIATRLLKGFGAELTVVGDGASVLQQVQEQTFDLVLMDIHMPKVNGLEAIERMQIEGMTIPIVALTAEVIGKVIEELEAKNVPYIGKPFRPESLYQIIKDNLNI